MARHRRRAAIAALAAGPLVIAGLAPLTAQAAPARSLVASVPAWVGHARALAAKDALTAPRSLTVDVVLRPRNAASLAALAASVSTPGSASFRHFLTHASYLSRFEPTAAAVASVERYLASTGVRTTAVGPENRYISATGTTTALAAAFNTHFATFVHGGRVTVANTSPATVPASLAGVIGGVDGLDTTPVIARPASAYPPPAGYVNARPCGQYYGQVTARYQEDGTTPLPKYRNGVRNYAVCGYTPAQIAGAYGVTSGGLSGKGATVAIVDAYYSPTMLQDANTYFARNGMPTFGAGQYTEVLPAKTGNASLCQANGWYGEESLDVEAVHGVAPNAKVIYYGAQSCTGPYLYNADFEALANPAVNIVTNSWSSTGEYGIGLGMIQMVNQLGQEAAVQGQTVQFSTGDNGDNVNLTGSVSANFPATDPWLTAVGGTSMAINGADQRQFEYSWGTDKYSLSADGTSWDPVGFLYGSGGGYSTLFNRPAYQQGVVTSVTPGRAIPDVSAIGDPQTGMLVGETQTFPSGVAYGEYRIGGTSLASPILAGINALAVQKNHDKGLGFINPVLYALSSSGSSAIHDILAAPAGASVVRINYNNSLDSSEGYNYSIRTFGNDSSLTTGPGWDDSTGVGTPGASYPRVVAASTSAS